MVSELANRWPARNPLSCDVTLREDVELHGGGTRCADDVAFTLTRLTTGGAINIRPRHGTNRRKNVGVDKIIFDVIFPRSRKLPERVSQPGTPPRNGSATLSHPGFTQLRLGAIGSDRRQPLRRTAMRRSA